MCKLWLDQPPNDSGGVMVVVGHEGWCCAPTCDAVNLLLTPRPLWLLLDSAALIKQTPQNEPPLLDRSNA